MSAILTVSELTSGVKELVESEFPFVWVRGQVQGVSRPPSGHIYFSLTDGNASLSTVWFKGNQWHGSSAGEQVHPVTGEIIPLKTYQIESLVYLIWMIIHNN